ncbi:uncharacterized protein LOC112126669 [Cimex lectularius]|uniref:Uncharacterized protein n=1 Tax=Cimex lectularius TaxID=79782 RepID=A0A8I6SIV0_CIMLE|nr:uncharacterized protein LOC112126669 [Cimex lectularius]
MEKFPTVSKCCCCCSLCTGSKLIGYCFAINALNSILYYSLLLAGYVYFKKQAVETFSDSIGLKTVWVIQIIVQLINFGSAILLLIGISQKSRYLMKIWIIITLVFIIVETIVNAIESYFTEPSIAVQLLAIIIRFVLTDIITLYFVCVVNSYSLSLDSED